MFVSVISFSYTKSGEVSRNMSKVDVMADPKKKSEVQDPMIAIRSSDQTTNIPTVVNKPSSNLEQPEKKVVKVKISTGVLAMMPRRARKPNIKRPAVQKRKIIPNPKSEVIQSTPVSDNTITKASGLSSTYGGECIIEHCFTL